MSDVKKLPKWAIAAIAALVLLGIGSAVYSSGWSQGFLMGVLTGNLSGNVEGAGAIAPYVTSRAHGWHGNGFGGGFFGFFGFIFRIFFTVLMIGLLFKFLGFLRWRRHAWGRHGWHNQWQGPGGHGYGCQGGPWDGPRGRYEGSYDERVEGHYGPQQYGPPWARQPQPGQPTPSAQGQPIPPTMPSGTSGSGEGASSGGSDPEHKPQPTSWTQL